MNLSLEIKAHINRVLNREVLDWLFSILDNGQTRCRDFMAVHREFFDCEEYLNTVPGILLTYCINKQIKKQCAQEDSPFLMRVEEINTRNGYAIPVLRIEDVGISIIRSTQRLKLENVDKKYLMDKCRKNEALNYQLSMFDSAMYLKKGPFHGVLLYGVNACFDGIKFADIVFFDRHLKEIEYFLPVVGGLSA